PPSIRAVKPEVDPALEAIISIMLAKNESERFPSLRDVSRALASLVPRRSQAADRRAIMSAVAPDLLEPRSALSLESATDTMSESAPALTAFNPDADETVPVGAQNAGVVEPPGNPVEEGAPS